MEGHPSTWALATGVGDRGGVAGFWLQPSSAVAAILGVNQWIEDTNQLINQPFKMCVTHVLLCTDLKFFTPTPSF